MPLLKNKRHELFAGLFAKTNNAEESYIKSGYSENGADAAAWKLQRNRKVSARITELKGEIARLEIESAKVCSEKTGIDKAWVIKELIEVVEMGKQSKPVKNKEGEAIGEYQQNLSAANKALELIGKELNMFVERSEIVNKSPLEYLEHSQLKDLQNQLLNAISFNKSQLTDTSRATH